MFLCCVQNTGDEDRDLKVLRRKLVIVGDGECGKTSLLHRFTEDLFLPEFYIPTVFDTCIKDVYLPDKHIELVLHDTAGQEDFEVLRPLSYRDADVIVMCYSVDNPDSLQNIVEHWSPEIRHYCGNVPIVLVGNKVDLRYEVPEEKASDQPEHVTLEEGNNVATRIGAEVFCETSAKLNQGVSKVFSEAVQLVLTKKTRKK